jgi:hypothetical protein
MDIGIPARVLHARDEVFMRDKYFQHHKDVNQKRARVLFTRLKPRDRHFIRYSIQNLFDNMKVRSKLFNVNKNK